MNQTIQRSAGRRKHLLTVEQLACHAGATADDLVAGVRHGNGLRVHRSYLIVISLVTLVFLVMAIAVASATT